MESIATAPFVGSAPLSDEALIRGYANGDAKAFEALYLRHEMRIWRYLERNVRNAAIADELMQEVWLSVAREAARYQPRARFSTWLFTIAHNRLVDTVRTRRAQVSLEVACGTDHPVAEQLIDDPQYEPHVGALAFEQAEALNRAVAALPEEQREAFLLHAEGDLTVEEIAAVMACAFETAKSRLRYARAKLRALLKDYL